MQGEKSIALKCNIKTAKTANALDLDSSRTQSIDTHVRLATSPGLPPQNGTQFSLSEVSYPEGGLRAWMSVLGGFLLLISSFGFLNCFSVFQTWYATHQLAQSSASAIAWIGSVQFFGIFAFGLIAGILMDKRGARFPVTIGAIFFLLGIFMTSICKKYYQFFLAQGVCCAIGLGLIMTPALTACAQYFDKKRSVAQALVISGSSVGGTLWPIALNRLLVHHGISFGWSVRLIGFAQLAILLVGIHLLNTRFTHTITGKPPIKAALKDARYLTLILAALIANFGVYLPFFFISDYALSRGTSVMLSFYMASILNSASFFGRWTSGLLAHYVGPGNVAILSCGSCAAVAFCWTACKDNTTIIIFCCFYGFASGGTISLLAPMALRLCPTPSTAGFWVGFASFSISFGCLGSAPIGGRLLTQATLRGDDEPFDNLVHFQGPVLAAATIFFALSRFLTGKRTWIM